MNGPLQRIASHYLLTPRGVLPGRVVSVDGQGVIVDISAPENIDRQPGVQFYSGILVPGFVNAHCHLELSHLRSAIAPKGGFTAFAKGVRDNRERFTQKERIAAARFWDAKMWAEGISAIGDICNDDSVFGVKNQSRIAYHSFVELFGLNADPQKATLLCSKARQAGVRASVTPHSTYSLNRAPLAAAVGSSENRPLSIHFMESESESQLFHGKGNMWEWYVEEGLKPDFTDFDSPAERLVAQIPANRPVMLIHNCCVTQRDIDIVMEHFTAPVTWVLCPASNEYLSGLKPPVDLLRKNRLNIAVGTDSLASNRTLSMIGELSRFKGVPLEELLGWATLNGAKALELESRVGSIEIGKSPGLTLLSNLDMETMTLTADTKSERIL